MRNLFARLFGTKGRRETEAEIRDPALLLARDWVLAQGGRVIEHSTDLLTGTLPDGTSLGYTRAPNRLRLQPDLALLMPNTLGLDTLQQDIAARVASLVLRITQPPEAAITLARAAFAPPQGNCHVCVSEAHLSDEHERCSDLCAECPLRQGRLVLAGADAVRDAQIIGERVRAAHEYTFRMSVTSARGRRGELVRVAVDVATGERLAPLDVALFQDAQRAPSDDEKDTASDPREQVGRAEALLQPAVQAAGRLARAQALQNYQRQQDDLTATFERLLIEAPEAGQLALKARERALERLAETYAIKVDTQLVAATTIQTPVVETRVRWRDGASLQAAVDVCRGTIAPRCAACGSVWRVGARCAERHITCLSCQKHCVHCGRRHCSLCASPAFDTCVTCGGQTCAACARATARGRHQIRFAVPAPAVSVDLETASSLPSLDPHTHAETGITADDLRTGITADDLRIGDLDTMTTASWHTYVVWMLEEMGYTVEGELDQGTAELVFVCHASEAAGYTGHGHLSGTATSGARLVAIGYRPARDADASLTPALLARICKRAEVVPGVRVLLITTARNTSVQSDERNGHTNALSIDVFDRSRLARWLSEQPTAHHRARERAADAADERAAAAAHLRAVVVGALTHTASQFSLLREGLPSGEGREVSDQSDGAGAIFRQITVVRQALSALETLIEQWEAAFAPQAARDGTQELTASISDFEELTLQAEHLVAVLQNASGAITSMAAGDVMREWLEAVRDELVETCQSLATRCKALDPLAWRSFDAVRDPELARESVEHLAAARRAGARARKLHDEKAIGEQNRSMRPHVV